MIYYIKIVNKAYIAEWKKDKYVVTHNDSCGEYDREFLALDGSNFRTMEHQDVVPLFDSIDDARNAWMIYKENRDRCIADVDKRKIVLEELN